VVSPEGMGRICCVERTYHPFFLLNNLSKLFFGEKCELKNDVVRNYRHMSLYISTVFHPPKEMSIDKRMEINLNQTRMFINETLHLPNMEIEEK